MRTRYAGPWKFTLGDAQNPHNGYITTANGESLMRRACMNTDDSKAMFLIAAAPTMMDALEAIRARIHGQFDHPALNAYGPLQDTQTDILNIALAALIAAGSPNV